MTALRVKQLLQLRTADCIISANLFHSKLFGNMFLQIENQTMINFGVAFIFGGFFNLLMRLRRECIPPYDAKEKLLQI